MKKRIGMLTVIGCIFFSGMFVGGCRMPDTVKGTLSSDGTIYDVESYKLSGDVTFLPISVQKIDNHSAESTVITEFVNIKDKMVCRTKDIIGQSVVLGRAWSRNLIRMESRSCIPGILTS